MIYIAIIALALFFTINMGGASFAASFSPAYGGRVIGRRAAAVLFTFFVVLGAVTFGKNVSVTLGEEIMPAKLLSYKAIIVIFLAAGGSMFVSNMMKIPQSTSIVTVAAISGVAVYYASINIHTIFYMMGYWLVLPIACFAITFLLGKMIYPPHAGNYWIYQKLVNHRRKLIIFVIITSCYNAFSVGTNNVANVVGPLMGLGKTSLVSLLLVFALFYGLGAFIFTGPLKTAGEEIVPLGLMSVALISFVSGTLMIFASWKGVPQSFVMLQMGTIFAISSLKQGHHATFKHKLTRKTLFTWTINPLITFVLTIGLSYLVLGRG